MRRIEGVSWAAVLVIAIGLGGCGSESTEKKQGQPGEAKEGAGGESTAAKPATCDGKALEPCQKACDGGDVHACAQAGRMLGWGEDGATKDTEAAQPLITKACDAGDGMGCRLLGIGKLFGVAGFAKDQTAGFAASQKGCDAGDLAACGRVGWAYTAGAGVKKDVEKGMELLGQTCDKGSSYGCYNLAEVYEKKEKYKQSAPLYEKACELGNAASCVGIAIAYEGGWGVKKDKSKVQPFYLKGCELGEPMGCYYAGTDFRDGKSVAKDLDKAKEYFDKGCQRGHQKSCKARKKMDQPTPDVGPCNATSWYAVCNGKCVDTASNRRHCGDCNQRCPSETFCKEGRCRDAQGGYWSTE